MADLHNILQSRGITLHCLAYRGAEVAVYKASFREQECAVKILTVPAGDQWEKVQKEYELMSSVQHPNILRVLQWLWQQVGTQWYFCLLTEWKQKDLMQDVNARRVNRYPYTEAELWSFLKQTVSALAFLQRREIAHRDIKPQNIFLDQGGKWVVGDFGSARRLNGEAVSTLVGTPYFLSPKLKCALIARQYTCDHCPYKSDVYSLGISLLTMMLLDLPQQLATVEDMSDSIGVLLEPLAYSEGLKSWVRFMCMFDENIRWDFITADENLNGVSVAENRGDEEQPGGIIGDQLHQDPEIQQDPMQKYIIEDYEVFEELTAEELMETKTWCNFCSREPSPLKKGVIYTDEKQFCGLECFKSAHKLKERSSWF